MNETSTAAYRVKGSTDEVTTCGYCGRDELKGTVVLAVLDADGNDTGEVAYYGTGCAASAGKRKVKEIRDEAKTADTAAREAKRAIEEAKVTAWCAGRDAWIAENIGADARTNPRKYGYSSPVALVKAYRAATGA